MVHGAVRGVFQFIGAALAGLLIAVPVFVWRLNSGPVALDFLTPYIEQALTARDGSLTVRLDATVLLAGHGDRMLEIHAVNVRAYLAGADQPIVSVPDMALSLSGRALLRAEIVPHAIRLSGLRIRLRRDAAGALQWGIGGGEGKAPTDAGAVVTAVKDAMLGVPDPAKPGRALQVLSISDADFMIEDQALGTTWYAPGAEFSLRRVAGGVLAAGKASLDLAGEKGDLAIEAAYHKADGAVDGTLHIAGFRPAVLARFGGPMAQLGVIDMPLAGTVRGRMNATGEVETLAFDLSGGAGSLNLPAPFSAPHLVASASLRGELTRAMTHLDLTEARIDLGGPTLTLAAVADGLGGETVIKADGSIRDVPVDSVHDLWPEGLAQDARDWVIPNLSKGMVRDASITISARSASGRFDDVVIDHLGGEVHPEGVTVDYLHPMPVARNVAADCTFDNHAFRIALKAGELYGLRLKDGSVILSGLDKPDQFADIELAINGPATDALRLIDSQPLRYAQALGIEPAKVGGDAAAKVHFKFPLLKTLRLDDVEIKANATVKNVTIPKVMMGLDLDGGTLALEVDAKGLDASGPVVLGSIPATLAWRENFAAKGAPFRSRYQLTAPSVSEVQRKELGLDGPPFVAPFVTGPIGANLTATFADGGKGGIEAKLDLAAARMQLPGLGWSKEPGKPGNAELSLRLDHKVIAALPGFTVSAGDLDARGSVAFTPDGMARRVEFTKLAYGRTNGEGSIAIRRDKDGGRGLDVVFKGDSFNAEPTFSRDEAQKRGERSEQDKPPPMTVTANVKTMWLSEKGALTNASATLQRDAEDWRSLTLKGSLPGNKVFTASLQPGTPKRRSFSASSDDAGALFRAFDAYGSMSGGLLSVDGYMDDSRPEQPFVGTLKVSDYYIRNAPALARLLTVVAMTGIVDVLQGEGVGFSSLEVPFTLSDGLLTVHDGRAWGAALGLTAKGEIDLDRSRMALEGTVVPAYVFNSVLGNIPVLGWLITGGDKGGGVIAFNYTMKGPTADPSVVVNPLSMLTPGFLRKLFNIFDDGSATDARKGDPARP